MHQFEINTTPYSMTYHPAGEGVKLVSQLFAVAAEPLGRVLNSFFAQLLQKIVSGEISLDADLKEGLAGLDLNQFDLSSVATDLKIALGSIDELKLIKSIVKYAIRDGQPLSNDAAFDRAFQKNYGELAQLLIYLVAENGFLGFFSNAFTGSK